MPDAALFRRELKPKARGIVAMLAFLGVLFGVLPLAALLSGEPEIAMVCAAPILLLWFVVGYHSVFGVRLCVIDQTGITLGRRKSRLVILYSEMEDVEVPVDPKVEYGPVAALKVKVRGRRRTVAVPLFGEGWNDAVRIAEAIRAKARLQPLTRQQRDPWAA